MTFVLGEPGLVRGQQGGDEDAGEGGALDRTRRHPPKGHVHDPIQTRAISDHDLGAHSCLPYKHCRSTRESRASDRVSSSTEASVQKFVLFSHSQSFSAHLSKSCRNSILHFSHPLRSSRAAQKQGRDAIVRG